MNHPKKVPKNPTKKKKPKKDDDIQAVKPAIQIEKAKRKRKREPKKKRKRSQFTVIMNQKRKRKIQQDYIPNQLNLKIPKVFKDVLEIQ